MRFPISCALLLLLCCALPSGATAQPLSARATALAGAVTALDGDGRGSSNPASWATTAGWSVSFAAAQPYGLSDLRTAGARMVAPVLGGAFGLGARSFGGELYRESSLEAGYARAFHPGSLRSFYAGAAVQMHHVAIRDYGRGIAFGLSAGWLVAVSPGVWAGFRADNLNGPSLAGHEELPRSLSIGISYLAEERLRAFLDLAKDVRFPASVAVGVEFIPAEPLALRAGVATEPLRFSTGAGVRAGRLSADAAAERHELLGWTPTLSIGVSW